MGERSTTWVTPFQSLTTSTSPDLGSVVELTKCPMLIGSQTQAASKLGLRSAADAAREGKERPRSESVGVGELRCSSCGY